MTCPARLRPPPAGFVLLRSAAGAPFDFQAAVSWLIGILDGTSSAAADVDGAWVAVRAGVIAPVLQVAVWACMVMSVMLVVEAVYNSVISLGVKAIGWRPEWRFKWKPLDSADEEKGTAHFPMVLVQIPMYNELEVRTDHHKKKSLKSYRNMLTIHPLII